MWDTLLTYHIKFLHKNDIIIYNYLFVFVSVSIAFENRFQLYKLEKF
jgi:hypothetical protein